MTVDITNLSQNNLEQAFQVVYRGLANQRRLSFDSHGNCAYRGEGGAKCSIGHLIPAEIYSAYIENGTPEQNDFWSGLGLNFPSNTVVKFLDKIQDCHDGSNSIDEALSALEDYGKSKGWSLPQ